MSDETKAVESLPTATVQVVQEESQVEEEVSTSQDVVVVVLPQETEPAAPLDTIPSSSPATNPMQPEPEAATVADPVVPQVVEMLEETVIDCATEVVQVSTPSQESAAQLPQSTPIPAELPAPLADEPPVVCPSTPKSDPNPIVAAADLGPVEDEIASESAPVAPVLESTAPISVTLIPATGVVSTPAAPVAEAPTTVQASTPSLNPTAPVVVQSISVRIPAPAPRPVSVPTCVTLVPPVPAVTMPPIAAQPPPMAILVRAPLPTPVRFANQRPVPTLTPSVQTAQPPKVNPSQPVTTVKLEKPEQETAELDAQTAEELNPLLAQQQQQVRFHFEIQFPAMENVQFNFL